MLRSMGCACTNKTRDERRHVTVKRGALRLKQSGDEEWMLVELHGTDLASVILRTDAQWTREESGPELRVQAVSTSITLRCLATPIARCNARARPEAHDVCGLDQLAGQRRNNATRGVWRGLGVFRVRPTQRVASVFNDGVLKPSTSSEER